LDTHTALWLFNEHERLSPTVKALLLNDTHMLCISIASIWEIAIKVSLGKLPELNGGVGIFLAKINDMPITILPIVPRYAEIIETLPFIHRDPFDRMLIATAKANNMTILTADENIHKYDVSSMW